MTKSIYGALSSALVIGCMFSSCQSSKVAYGNDYYFKQTPKTVAAQEMNKVEAPEKVSSQAANSENLQVSIAPVSQQPQAVAARVQAAQQQLAETLAESGHEHLQQRVNHINELVAEAKDQNLSKQEMRAQRKEVRQEIKALVKEYRETAAPNKAEGLSDLDKNLRLAIIFWGVGLVLSIVTAATYVPAVGLIAGLAWLAGSVFFIIWLVEELS